jgi:hypothetical protein
MILISNRSLVRAIAGAAMLLAAGCASTEDQAPTRGGQAGQPSVGGQAPGVSRWIGASTGLGPGGACPSFQFDLTIDGSRASGTATTAHPWGIAGWDVSGTVGAGGDVQLIGRSRDARVGMPLANWSGRLGEATLDLIQAPLGTCGVRTARLSRVR